MHGHGADDKQKGQTNPDETPASSQSPPKTPTPPPSISNENPTTNQSSSPPITPNTTTAATTAKPPTDPKCSYSVELIQFGFQIKMTDFTPDNYTIYVAEKESPSERKATVFFYNETSTHDIKPLKPCTEYELNVTLNVSNVTKIFCNTTENKTVTTISTKTTGMTERDIKSISCPHGYFCYQSGWNIRSLLKENNKVSDVQFINGSYRIKPAYESICSELVLEFPQGKCTNITFTITENVPFDFIDVNDVIQPKPTELPAKIEPELPPNCQDLSVEYKCSGMNNDSVEPSDMKPFTNYSCTGDIKNKNGSIIQTLPPVQFSVSCDFSINFLQTSPTYTSIKLNWEPKSDECKGILDKLTELSYSCSCQPDWKHGEHDANEGEVDQRTCNINRLGPYKDYTCIVNAIYNKTRTFKDTIQKVKTKPGIPILKGDLEVQNPVNNAIKVSCRNKRIELNGPQEKLKYIANLHGFPAKELESSSCEFEFTDLSYLTSYTVEVVIFNGYFESKPLETSAATLYNDKALVGFLVFLIIISILCAVLFIMKTRKSRNVVNEEQMVNLEEIYVNMPPPKRNHNNY